MVLKSVSDKSGLVRCALRIDHKRQVAAQTHRVHVVEEERAMAAEQILNIVLGGGEQDVDPGILHEAIKPSAIEGNGELRLLSGVEHLRASYMAREGGKPPGQWLI